jgi:hypothetical protein
VPLVVTLRGLTWDRPIDTVRPSRGTIVITGMAFDTPTGWRSVNLHRDVADAWRAEPAEGQASDSVTVTTAGVTDHFTNRNGGYGGVTYGSVPASLPGVATPTATVTSPGHDGFVFDGNTSVAVTTNATSPVLPVVLGNGAHFDVRFLQAELPQFAAEASWQIWLGPHAPPDALARLRRAGLVPQQVRTTAEREAVLARQGPALALVLLAVSGTADAALTLGAALTSMGAASRRRTYELAALRVVGISRWALLRVGAWEQLLLVGATLALAVPAGLLAARLAMPVIPEFSDTAPIALTYTPQAVTSVVFAAGLAVLLAIAALAAGAGLLRMATPGRLRESEWLPQVSRAATVSSTFTAGARRKSSR